MESYKVKWIFFLVSGFGNRKFLDILEFVYLVEGRVWVIFFIFI